MNLLGGSAYVESPQVIRAQFGMNCSALGVNYTRVIPLSQPLAFRFLLWVETFLKLFEAFLQGDGQIELFREVMRIFYRFWGYIGAVRDERVR